MGLLGQVKRVWCDASAPDRQCILRLLTGVTSLPISSPESGHLPVTAEVLSEERQDFHQGWGKEDTPAVLLVDIVREVGTSNHTPFHKLASLFASGPRWSS